MSVSAKVCGNNENSSVKSLSKSVESHPDASQTASGVILREFILTFVI